MAAEATATNAPGANDHRAGPATHAPGACGPPPRRDRVQGPPLPRHVAGRRARARARPRPTTCGRAFRRGRCGGGAARRDSAEHFSRLGALLFTARPWLISAGFSFPHIAFCDPMTGRKGRARRRSASSCSRASRSSASNSCAASRLPPPPRPLGSTAAGSRA